MRVNRVDRKPGWLDPGILVVLVICAIAFWPFVSRGALPQATDAELHIFRVAELGRLVRGGEIFARWAPNFYYGYGYPIFNYYAPLSYYLALGTELLPFWDAVDGVKFVFLLSILLGGLGTYGFVRRNWGRMPALVASALYIYGPYILFVDPHARGDLAESLSFGLFPVALLAMDALRSQPGARSWLLAVGATAALVLSHNLMALVFAAILLGWCVWQSMLTGPVPIPERVTGVSKRLLALRLFLALAVGIGVAAFFWLTVALEQDSVNLTSLIGEGGNFDYRNHFLSIGELLSPPKFIDWSASEPDFVLAIGPLQWILGAAGVVALLSGRAYNKKQGAFFALVAAVLVFFMLPASRFIWDLLPLLPFLQFPWRLLGATAFAVAVLGAVAAGTLMTSAVDWARRWMLAFLVALIIISVLPLIQIPPWPAEFGPTTALRVVQEELSGRWLGTTSTSDFVPATVDTIPGPTGTVLEDFFAERSLDRVNRATLPENTTVVSNEVTPLSYRYQVTGDSDFLLRLYLFAFPGWTARIDGEEVESELGRPEGFLVVPVQSGQHTVEVSFEATPERRFSFAVSVLAALVAVVYALWLDRARKGILLPKRDAPPAETMGGRIELVAVSLVALLLFSINAIFVEPNGWLRLESPPYEALPAEHSTYNELGGQLALIGYDTPEDASPGEAVPFTAYWQALRTPESNYQVFVHLVDEEGAVVAQSDALNPGDFPTKRWTEDKYVRDEHEIKLPADLPPGSYQWSIGLWQAAEERRLPVTDAQGNSVGDSILLPSKLVVE